MKPNMRKEITDKISQIRHFCKENKGADQILDQLDELEKLILGEEKQPLSSISAQLSIYPLRQPSLSPTINQALDVLNTYNLKLIPGSMSTLILGEEGDIWQGLQEMFSTIASQGEVVMIVTISNACPKSQV